MITSFALFNISDRLREVVSFAERTMDSTEFVIEFRIQRVEEITVSGKPYRVAGKYEPTVITIYYNEEVSTMFRLAFHDIIIYESSIQHEKATD